LHRLFDGSDTVFSSRFVLLGEGGFGGQNGYKSGL
jgi:hypothetical protein